MSRFDTSGLSRAALEGTYQILLVKQLCLEAKIERLKKELAVGACAIKDGNADLKQIENGLLNLIAYIECKNKLPDELNIELGSLELVEKHMQAIKEYELNRAGIKK